MIYWSTPRLQSLPTMEFLLLQSNVRKNLPDGDEYDAAQERGEVASRGGERSGKEHSVPAPTAADIGLTRKEIHEARQVSVPDQNSELVTAADIGLANIYFHPAFYNRRPHLSILFATTPHNEES